MHIRLLNTLWACGGLPRWVMKDFLWSYTTKKRCEKTLWRKIAAAFFMICKKIGRVWFLMCKEKFQKIGFFRQKTAKSAQFESKNRRRFCLSGCKRIRKRRMKKIFRIFRQKNVGDFCNRAREVFYKASSDVFLFYFNVWKKLKIKNKLFIYKGEWSPKKIVGANVSSASVIWDLWRHFFGVFFGRFLKIPLWKKPIFEFKKRSFLGEKRRNPTIFEFS